MNWIPQALDFLSENVGPGYVPGGAGATEPTALSALALSAHGRDLDAANQLQALTKWQAPDGSLGVTETESQPQWPTALAVIAWNGSSVDSTAYRENSQRAVRWMLQQRGEIIPPRQGNIGHDTTLVGWPWVAGTHSWLEPTAYALLALKSAGQSQHLRAREAARLLTDRLLPEGGCNYGNTFVLGQQLRPHVQPTGLVMIALAGETTVDPRVRRSLDFLQREAPLQHSAASLAYATLGLAAHGRAQANTSAKTDTVKARSRNNDQPSFATQMSDLAERALGDGNVQRLALLLLAVEGGAAPLIPTLAVDVLPDATPSNQEQHA
ncbi:MAG: hypothetical protein MPJ50_03490 [Pirellulales bacterium]|nr:hypothetical protein [Pirellulales bacterium]